MPTPQTIRLIVVVLAILVFAFPVNAGSRTTILIVFDESPELPGLAIISRRMRETFKADLGTDVEFVSASLNLSHFDAPGYQDALLDHFARTYATKRPDLIVAVMQPSLEFLLNHRQALFPNVPIVFCGIDASYLDSHTLPPSVNGVSIKRDYAPSLELTLRLQPDLQNLYIVGGTSEFDRQLQQIARNDLAPFENRVHLTYLTELAMPELLATVAALPDKSAVLYLTIFTDSAGNAFIPHDALAQITGVANAPVYVAVDQFLDLGVVGGHVYSVDSHGRQAAQIGVRILRGGAAADLPVVEQAAFADVFDWRQLERWHIDEARLPSGSEIRHRTPSTWDMYGDYILVGVTIAVLQSALIVGLLRSLALRRRSDAVARQAETRRRLAEDEARRQRDELAHALRLTTLGELTASITHEMGQPLVAIQANAQAVRRMAANGSILPGELDEALADIADDVKRATETIQRLRDLFRKQPPAQTLVDMNSIVDDIARLLRSDLKKKAIHVEVHHDESLPNVTGDAIQLRQVILNLLLNAEDAIERVTGGDREIRVETRASSEATVVVNVRDSGCGVEVQNLERMFERFESTKPNGLGMGLAISRSIVESHRGRIWATRNAEGGLSMHIELPVDGSSSDASVNP